MEEDDLRLNCSACGTQVSWDELEFVNGFGETDTKYGSPVCYDCYHGETIEHPDHNDDYE